MHKKNMYIGYLEVPKHGNCILVYESDHHANTYNHMREAMNFLAKYTGEDYGIRRRDFPKIQGIHIVLKPNDYEVGLYSMETTIKEKQDLLYAIEMERRRDYE